MITLTAYQHTDPLENGMAHAVLSGLSQKQKTVPSTWLYDERGSLLFEEITRLPEYYPTRCEIEILERHADEMASFIRSGATLIEFGSGSSRKTPLLLSALNQPKTYMPLDISEDYLLESAQTIAAQFPNITVSPQVLDFTAEFGHGLPLKPGSQRVGFFPGSTIGNLNPSEVVKFLTNARNAMGHGSLMIIGVDLQKPLSTLFKAYDDSRGVTAEFNKNILRRINRELDGNFDLDSFKHEARYNTTHNRIEMHLVSQRSQLLTVLGSLFVMEQNESIHTENSHKYTTKGFQHLAYIAGWDPLRVWYDRNQQFSVHMLVPRKKAYTQDL